MGYDITNPVDIIEYARIFYLTSATFPLECVYEDVSIFRQNIGPWRSQSTAGGAFPWTPAWPSYYACTCTCIIIFWNHVLGLRVTFVALLNSNLAVEPTAVDVFDRALRKIVWNARIRVPCTFRKKFPISKLYIVPLADVVCESPDDKPIATWTCPIMSSGYL